MGSPFGGGPGGNVQMSPAQEQTFLLSGRYVDDKGQAIPVGGGGDPSAAGAPPMGPPGGTPDPAAAAGPAPPLDPALFGVGYKRLPIRMVLRMDGRWLPTLISTCANEALRIEVQEVRINTPDIAGLDSGMTGGGVSMMPSYGPRGGMSGMPGGGGPGANLFPDHTGVQLFPQQPNVVNVAILGTIYIFNKPNPNILQQSGESNPAGATPPAGN